MTRLNADFSQIVLELWAGYTPNGNGKRAWLVYDFSGKTLAVIGSRGSLNKYVLEATRLEVPEVTKAAFNDLIKRAKSAGLYIA